MINSAGPTSTDASVITCQRVYYPAWRQDAGAATLPAVYAHLDHDDSGIDHRPDGNRNAARDIILAFSP